MEFEFGRRFSATSWYDLVQGVGFKNHFRLRDYEERRNTVLHQDNEKQYIRVIRHYDKMLKGANVSGRRLNACRKLN